MQNLVAECVLAIDVFQADCEAGMGVGICVCGEWVEAGGMRCFQEGFDLRESWKCGCKQ